MSPSSALISRAENLPSLFSSISGISISLENGSKRHSISTWVYLPSLATASGVPPDLAIASAIVWTSRVASALIACSPVPGDPEELEGELVELARACVGALARPQAPADVG